MNTIKFRCFDESYPIKDMSNDPGRFAQSTNLIEGMNIWHRPYNFNSKKEWEEWFRRFIEGEVSNLIVPGKYPDQMFNDWEIREKQGDLPEDAIPPSMYIEYMTFYDKNGDFKRCILLDVDCYIMNENGQTVDSFSA